MSAEKISSKPFRFILLLSTDTYDCLTYTKYKVKIYSAGGDLAVKVKVKVHTLDIAPLRSESPPQKRSGMGRVLKGFHSFTCTPTRSSAIGMSHTCLCLPSYNWYSFTDPGGMEG